MLDGSMKQELHKLELEDGSRKYPIHPGPSEISEAQVMKVERGKIKSRDVNHGKVFNII